jgi:hypothetical protein
VLRQTSSEALLTIQKASKKQDLFHE